MPEDLTHRHRGSVASVMEVREGFEPSNSGFAGRRVSHFATAPCVVPDRSAHFGGTIATSQLTAARAGGKHTAALQAW